MSEAKFKKKNLNKKKSNAKKKTSKPKTTKQVQQAQNEISKTEYTVYEAAQELGVTIAAIWGFINAGELDIVHTPKGVKIPEWSLRQFIIRNRWDRV